MTTQSPQLAGGAGGRIWFAQFLRAPACVMVVVAHWMYLYPRSPDEAAAVGHFPPIGPPMHVAWMPWINFEETTHISLGVIALVQLFMISGFVIPYSLERNAVRSFSARRVFRLYPTMIACLFLTAGTLWLQTHLTHAPRPFGGRTFVENATLLAPYGGREWIEPTMWTLPVEELFYVTAAFMAFRGVLGRAEWLVGVAAGITALTFVSAPPSNAALFWFIYNITLLPLIFVGVAIHEVYARRWSVTKGATVGATLFTLYVVALYVGPQNFHARVNAQSALLGALLFATMAWANPRIPYHRAIDGLASLSFPLYLLHGVNGYLLIHWLQTQGVSYYAALLIAAAAIVPLAIVMHHLVEMPSMRMGRRVGQGWVQRRDRRRAVAAARTAGTA